MSEKKYDHTYKLSYHLEPKDTLSSEREDGEGLCDAMICHSIIFPPDGSYSHYLVSLDGRTGEEMSSNELFKAWTMMAATLSKREDLPPGKKELVTLTWEAVCAAMRAMAEAEA
jgi:hypothetical protein